MKFINNLFAFVLLAFVSVNVANAATDSAKIKLNIKTPSSMNKYFVCLQGNGCLSVLAANKGRVYPYFSPIQMGNIYLANMDNLRVYPQGLPPSCNVKVNMNQTITLNGKIVVGRNNVPHITNLSCRVV